MEKKPPIQFRAIIEVLGKPKEHVGEMLKKYVDNIKEDKNLRLFTEKTFEPKEIDGVDMTEKDVKYFSAFSELLIEIPSFKELAVFCFNYMPSSVEVIKPDEFVLGSKEFSDLFNDLQARSHEVDRMVKELGSENRFLKRNVNRLLKNTILISLNINSFNIDSLSKLTGVKQDELKGFLEELTKEGHVEEKEGVYVLKRGKNGTDKTG